MCTLPGSQRNRLYLFGLDSVNFLLVLFSGCLCLWEISFKMAIFFIARLPFVVKFWSKNLRNQFIPNWFLKWVHFLFLQKLNIRAHYKLLIYTSVLSMQRPWCKEYLWTARRPELLPYRQPEYKTCFKDLSMMVQQPYPDGINSSLAKSLVRPILINISICDGGRCDPLGKWGCTIKKKKKKEVYQWLAYYWDGIHEKSNLKRKDLFAHGLEEQSTMLGKVGWQAAPGWKELRGSRCTELGLFRPLVGDGKQNTARNLKDHPHTHAPATYSLQISSTCQSAHNFPKHQQQLGTKWGIWHLSQDNNGLSNSWSYWPAKEPRVSVAQLESSSQEWDFQSASYGISSFPPLGIHCGDLHWHCPWRHLLTSSQCQCNWALTSSAGLSIWFYSWTPNL